MIVRFRLFLLSALLCLTAGLAFGQSSPAFMFVNRFSGKALDLIGGNTGYAAPINQWTFDYNSGNQHWALLPTEGGNHFKIISLVSGKCACIRDDSTAATAVLHTWDYIPGNPSHQWDLDDAGNGFYRIRNVRSGLVLDVAAFSTADNGTVIQWPNNGQANQLWRLQPWGDYFIKAASGRYVCVENRGSTNGNRIIQYDWENNPWFKWRFESASDGYLKVSSLNALGRVLCVQSGTSTAGQPCHLWDYNPSNIGDQKVRVLPKTNGKFKFYFVHDGMSWDIPAGQTGNNIPLTQWPNTSNAWQDFALERATTSTSTPNSIYSVAPSSIPAPAANGAMTFRVLNGTDGAYADNQVYWGVLGINPDNGRWSYLDLNGNLVPISNALNDAGGHLMKDGQNYANIYYTISQRQWISIPRITAARMFLSVGSPCFIKTFDSGFAGPNIDNPTDPNRNLTFDFIEFTIDNLGYHGNTTRVDMFGFPIQHRLVNRAGNYDRTVGEFESETRGGLFNKYQAEVPAEFKSLATDQAPYRIVAPIHGSFAPGRANANYFAGYSSIPTREILLGIGGAANPGVCAAINRHVYHLSNWNIVANYYNAAPANYYSAFWHRHSIDALAYGFCYDDVNEQAAYLVSGDPKGLIIRVGW
jgi:hypothetical protein